jgi:hypothetical protein
MTTTTDPTRAAGMRSAAGQRSEVDPSRSEHSPGGMLNGAEVIVHTCNGHRVSTHRGWVRQFASTPAPHLTMDVQVGPVPSLIVRRLIFCNTIDYIELA